MQPTLHTTLNTGGSDHAELLDLAVYLHVHVTRLWLVHAGAQTHLLRRVVYLTQRLAQERDEVTTLAMAMFGVADTLLGAGAIQRGQAKLNAITLPPTTAQNAGLICYLTAAHGVAAAGQGRLGDTAAPMEAAAEIAARFGATNEVDARGFLWAPHDAGNYRMSFALDGDEPDRAVSIAHGMHPEQHPIPAGQAYYWIYYGRALSRLRGRQDDAVRALRTAEPIFPTAVLRNQGVREALGELLTRGLVRGVMSVELRGMAYRAGVLTEQFTT